MGSEVDLDTARNEVLRKIGRNMLLFQQVEQMLKFLITNGKISGYASDIKEKQEHRASTVQKKTMGQLVGQFIENTHSDCEENTNEPEDLKEAYFSFNYKVESDAVYYETKRQALADIVADRNELIHHLLPTFNLQSIDNCLEADQYLDRQREKLLPEIEMLKSMIKSLQEGSKLLADFLNSEEGKKQFELSWLRQSRLVLLLGDIATQMARPDGWTLLNTAGQLIRQHAPEEMAVQQKRYGHKTLKELILAAEVFDIHEEPTTKGGIRVLYRLKPGWELQTT